MTTLKIAPPWFLYCGGPLVGGVFEHEEDARGWLARALRFRVDVGGDSATAAFAARIAVTQDSEVELLLDGVSVLRCATHVLPESGWLDLTLGGALTPLTVRTRVRFTYHGRAALPPVNVTFYLECEPIQKNRA